VAALRDTLPVKLNADSYQRVLSGNILYQGGFRLAAGKNKLKVVARENQSGRLGTFEQPLQLTETGNQGLALSSVVVSNQLQEAGPAGSRRGRPENPLQVGNRSILPSVTRVFAPIRTFMFTWNPTRTRRQKTLPRMPEGEDQVPRRRRRSRSCSSAAV